MSDGVDLEALAKRYLDLWQDQMSALAGDPEYAATVQRLVAAGGAFLPGGPTAWPAMMGVTPASKVGGVDDGENPQPGSAAKESGIDSQNGGPGRDHETGTAPSAAASGGGQPDLVELLGRLARLEERVAALESSPGGGRRGAAAKPRRGRD